MALFEERLSGNLLTSAIIEACIFPGRLTSVLPEQAWDMVIRCSKTPYALNTLPRCFVFGSGRFVC